MYVRMVRLRIKTNFGFWIGHYTIHMAHTFMNESDKKKVNKTYSRKFLWKKYQDTDLIDRDFKARVMERSRLI